MYDGILRTDAAASSHGHAGEVEMAVSRDVINFYRDWVTSARISQSTAEIPNEYPWNAQIAVEQLVQFAIDRQTEANDSAPVVIRLLTGTLSSHVYDEAWQSNLLHFVKLGGDVRILLWNEWSDHDHWALDGFESELLEESHFEMRVSGTRAKGEELNHFLVVGNDAYRNEAPHPYFSTQQVSDLEPEVPSRICFRDPHQAQELVEFFDKIWDACGPKRRVTSLLAFR